MGLTVVSTPRFADHVTPPGHPERPGRADVLRGVAEACRARGAAIVEPRVATTAELARVHAPEYIASIDATAGRAVALDPDTFTSPLTAEVARLAAGAALTAVDRVLDGPAGSRALVAGRPPGHHAERDRAMGFCVYNSVAVAAAHARARGVRRVAIVDYDVHHGNGTQWSFYDDPSVLVLSSHQYPFYPGTGAAQDTGRGAGAGFTVNLPLEAGTTNADIEAAFRAVTVPILDQFQPELLLLSAGFDAHADDPLGGLRLTAGQFGRLTASLLQVVDPHALGRVVAVTEGGYDLPALNASLTAVARVLAGEADVGEFERPEGPAPRGTRTVDLVAPILQPYWKLAARGRG
jgi:acetoin utilization deacetylase AcuC-like enzyme